MGEPAAEVESKPVVYPIVVKLRHPVILGSLVVEELSFRRGRLGDIKGMKLPEAINDVSSLLEIAGRLCGQTQAVMERIDGDDAEEVLEIAVGFLGRCLGTGKTP